MTRFLEKLLFLEWLIVNKTAHNNVYKTIAIFGKQIYFGWLFQHRDFLRKSLR